MKKVFFILLLTYSLSISYAQKVTTKTVLSSALKDKRLESNQQLSSLAKGLKFNMPIVKEVQFRFGINGNAFRDTIYGYLRNDNAYGIQVSTNSFAEIRKQKLIQQARVGVYETENRVLMQQILLDRYQSLVGYVYSKKIRYERLKLDSLLVKKHNILKQMMDARLEVRIKDVMDTEGDKNSVQQSLLTLENEQQLQRNKMIFYLANQLFESVDDSDFISVDQLTDVLNSLKLRESINPTFDFREAKSNLATAGLNYVNAQNRQIFNMFSINYNYPLYLDIPKRFNAENNLTIRIGLTLPLIGNNNFKRSQALLEQRETQIEAELARRQNAQSIDFQYVKIENLLKSFKLCQQQMEQSLIKKMLTNDKLLTQITPLEIVELQLIQQKLEVRAVELAHDITNDYVKFLELTGAMSTAPLKNYLSSTLETF